MVLPSSEAILEIIFCLRSQTLSRWSIDLWNRVKTVSFHRRFNLWEQPKITRYQVWRVWWMKIHGNIFISQKLADNERRVTRSVIMMRHKSVLPFFRTFSSHVVP
jgi:hypothetical protein